MHARRHRLGPGQRQPSPGPAPPPAPRAPAMPRRHPRLVPPPAPLGLRFRALLGLGFVPPPEPRPCAHCASIAYALLPAARVPLCRHRADPESSSRSLPSGSPARIAPIAPTVRRRPRPPLALRRPQGPGWQESRRMHPFSAECAKKAPFLATSARNACFSRSRWQHPRPMHPFPGAIGRFRIHGARILPPRALFRVEEPEITHGAKMLPALRVISAAAACGPAERALRHAARGMAERALRPAARAWPACRMRPPLPSRLCPPRPAPPAISSAFIAPSYMRRASPPASRPPRPAFRRATHCSRGERRSGSSCCPRAAHAAPTEPQPRANRAPAHPWSRLLPSAPRHPPRLALPRGSRCGSGNSREMVR